MDEDLVKAQDISGATVERLQTVINTVDNENIHSAGAIHNIAKNLSTDEHQGYVPTEKKLLEGIGLSESLASMVMQQVFGSTELVVGLDTRKLFVAVDMVDWEETGAEDKTAVKMAKVSAAMVKNSLIKWLPKGDLEKFQNTIEPLAAALGANEGCFWGKLNATLNTHFSVKDKKQLLNMANSVHQFCKATKSGGKTSRSCS